MYRIFTTTLLLLLLVTLLSSLSYSCHPAAEQCPRRITLGTFNMEWFGDNSPDDHKLRTQVDDKLLADVLRDTDADILAVQEIENIQAIERLIRYLPEYRFVMGKSGGKQHIGFLYRPPLGVTMIEEVTTIAVEKGRTRAGLMVRCNVGKSHWLMLGVHLKSTSRADSTQGLKERSVRLRQLQAAQIRAWTDSVVQLGREPNIIILGDFNDSPCKKQGALDTLNNTHDLVFLTGDLKSSTYSALHAIDHIIVSKSMVKCILPGTLRIVNFRAMLPHWEMERVSDHCPVVVQIYTP